MNILGVPRWLKGRLFAAIFLCLNGINVFKTQIEEFQV
jgi:hypothetical protein